MQILIPFYSLFALMICLAWDGHTVAADTQEVDLAAIASILSADLASLVDVATLPGTGGEGAPDVTETLKNLAINGAAIAALGYIVRRDLNSSDRDKRVVEREESLARLQVRGHGAQSPKCCFWHLQD